MIFRLDLFMRLVNVESFLNNFLLHFGWKLICLGCSCRWMTFDLLKSEMPLGLHFLTIVYLFIYNGFDDTRGKLLLVMNDLYKLFVDFKNHVYVSNFYCLFLVNDM